MKSIRKILVPVDFSSCSRAAVEYAASLAPVLDATLDLMHAWQPPYDFGPVLSQASIEEPEGGRRTTLAEFLHTSAGQELKRLLSELEARGLSVQGRLEAGHAKKAIIEAAASGNYDLVVMGTHGRTGLRHLVMGSVAEWVVRHASIPVLTVREALGREAAALTASPAPG